MSFVEANVNVLIGMIVSTLSNMAILPLVLGITPSVAQLGMITLLFTAVSIARQYVIRRWFATHTGSQMFKLSYDFHSRKDWYLQLRYRRFNGSYRTALYIDYRVMPQDDFRILYVGLFGHFKGFVTPAKLA